MLTKERRFSSRSVPSVILLRMEESTKSGPICGASSVARRDKLKVTRIQMPTNLKVTAVILMEFEYWFVILF